MLQKAVLANRVTDDDPDTTEIRQLTEAAGADVVGTVTQRRQRDPGTVLGAGKVETVAEMVESTGADTVVVDEPLTPQQTIALEAETGVSVIDRHRLVLEIFARHARSRRAQYQVELARLRYRLPRVRERADEGMLNRRTERGTRYYDLLDRIDELERKRDDLPPVGREFQHRRDQGFDLVAITGYTNAGKSTLLRRLADDMSLSEASHDDIDHAAATGDRLFETLETTTRRATIRGRELLLTDTVGFLDELPHWLVESFRGTLTAVEKADLVVLVADAAQDSPELRRKLRTVRETLPEDHPPIVPVFNKIDRVDHSLFEKHDDLIDESSPEPVPISARTGSGLSTLEARIAEALPDLTATELSLPLTDEGMSVLSRIHDDAVDVDVEYRTDEIQVQFRAKEQTVKRLRGQAETVG